MRLPTVSLCEDAGEAFKAAQAREGRRVGGKGKQAPVVVRSRKVQQLEQYDALGGLGE